jgi:thiol-disulfide isomerase/thioredoxin/TolA-binding protein
MSRSIFVVAVLLALSLALSPARAGALDVGDAMNLSFVSVDGQQVSMQALAGKIVIVDMWATWCGPCMDEAPHMVQLNKKYGDKGLQIIGISLDDDRAALLATAAREHFTWPQYFDGRGWDNQFARMWNIRSIPHAFLIGPDGTILWQGHPALLDQPVAEAFLKHPPVLVDPAVVAAANATLDKVDASLSDDKPGAAMKRMADVPADAAKDQTFAARLGAEKRKLSDAADKMLADVDGMIEQKQYVDASTKLEDLRKALTGLPEEDQIRQRIDKLMADPDAKARIDKARRESAAGDMLAAAQKLKKAGKDALAYKQFKDIVAEYADTAAGATAAEAAADYEKDPAFVQSVKSNDDADKANAMLSIANSYRSSGMADKAKEKYQSVVDQFPGTPQADAASKALAEMASQDSGGN